MARNHTERQEPKKAGTSKEDNNEFPGYPHYAAKEDIMDTRSDAERVNIDVENLPNFHNATSPHRLNPGMDDARSNSTPAGPEADMEADLGIEMGTEADVTSEERKMLEDDMYYPTQDEDRLRQARLDDTDFDGEKLNEESFGAGQAESGTDLDIDASSEPVNHTTAEDDEENQYWSLGGDKNDHAIEETS